MQLLHEGDGRAGIALARAAITAALDRDEYQPPPLPPIFDEKRGVFVTLTQNKELRGCIGLPMPVMPLGEAIIEAARSAAFRDPRFPPLRSQELPLIRIELTVLSLPEEIPGTPEARADQVIIGRHGLIIQGRGRSGLLLPQVAAEYGWSGAEFLDQTCMKAGLPPGCWRDDQITALRFEGQIFSE
ncbi:uncharacterized protein (TIGR00296 family) [Methanocalculus alkaliphilus]|uniref:TIGR00296 family protein n=1 Tax=Methanocalculus alkaliphilus TaxID=768730 RepID=UPI00209C747E|nr:TIGR00296 family protein [Methanocalculus alkaliphilus]MCP1715167.1 uncharacterized protein (TIGR00296 family) [Methanocalculus alkaliphilus]